MSQQNTKLLIMDNGTKQELDFDAAYNEWKKYIEYRAYKLSSSCDFGGLMDKDDIFQNFSAFGLQKAFDSYDIDRGVKFRTHLTNMIRQQQNYIMQKAVRRIGAKDQNSLEAKDENNNTFIAPETERAMIKSASATWDPIARFDIFEAVKGYRENLDDLGKVLLDTLLETFDCNCAEIAAAFGKTRQAVSLRLKKMKKDLQQVLADFATI